ncbi:MAG: DUF4345 domain-containing protein [Pseudoxanthomonas sp.]
MVNAYLYLNAALYALLAAWCTLAPARTAAAVGYQVLDKSGQSEYLVIYGGLQLGMAFLFAYFAWTSQPRNGLVLALAFYVPIVLYRAFTLASLWPLAPATLVLSVLEWLLLIAGAMLWLRLRGGR